MAVHVRYKAWYISLPFSEKQQREMTKFYQGIKFFLFLSYNQ